MAHQDKLSAVLSDFARTMATDFPIQGILDHLVQRIVEILPVTAAGVTLISPGSAPHYVSASSESALRYERLQAELGEGPCLLAFHTDQSVLVPDLSADSRFPRFAPRAMAAGLGAVFTFPLRQADRRLGALDLYRETTGALKASDLASAQTLADVAAAYLLNAQARDEARLASESFHHSSLHDPLTGLPNRALLEQRIEHAAARARRSHASAAIMFADLDRFKRVNDTHGHRVGDELLIAVAHRFAGLVRGGDTLARVSGDEFVFLCEDLESAEDANMLARRVTESCHAPFLLDDVTLSVSVSVGVAFAGPGVEISDALVVDADIAMYEAKRKGVSGHQILDSRLVFEANTLEADLRTALREKTLEVAYQPVVRSADGHIMGVEALLRWTHPERGPIPAAILIAAAERSTLIADIGAWVLERSCRDRSRWLEDQPGSALDLAVNVSVRQLMGPDFVGTVAEILDKTGMDPAALILEMTETSFLEDIERATVVLADLNQLGIRIALDDFGTGYSSLSYLRRLPIHIVKIDQSFVADIGQAPAGRAIVAAITNLAHVLGLSVTAEGVETKSQSDEVAAIGCESSQGYFYARPMSAALIASQLATETDGAANVPAHCQPGT